MKQIDKLSQWLKSAVQSGDTAPLAVAKAPEQGPKPAAAQKPAGEHHPKQKSKGRGDHGGRGQGGHGGQRRQGGRGGHRNDRGGHGGRHEAHEPIEAAMKPSGPAPIHKGAMRIIPIGGLEEVGKNCMIVEYEDDILVIDMGFQFPEEEMLGVDYVIPDIRYLVERRDRIRGILVTHGHLDHIGALPFVLPDLNFPPIYTFSLTSGLIQKQLDEHRLNKKVTINLVDNKTVYNFGKFQVEFFRVNHSIPDSNGIYIRSPEGSMIHTGDFKFDFTPADGVPSDIKRIAEFGKRGVNILFSDSTNANKPGHTISEKVVAENLEHAIANAEGRIIIASFASLIGRIQQIVDFAAQHGRKVFLSGRSMEANAEIAHKLGFLKFPKEQLRSIREVKNVDDKQILILTTGSQGEPLSALSRMATDTHTHVKIKKGDTVVVSSSPIIGNEKATAFLVDRLARQGAHIVHNKIMDVHTSGHGQQEDLKMMLSLARPEHLVPIHGNYYMRQAHADLFPQMGMPAENAHLMDNGNVIEIRGGKVEFKKEDVKVNYVVVDGLGRGELGSQVLKDRELMAENGVVEIVLKVKGQQLVDKPLVSTHGFVYQRETEKILREVEKEVAKAFNQFTKAGVRGGEKNLEKFIRNAVAGYIARRLDRRPVISTHAVYV